MTKEKYDNSDGVAIGQETIQFKLGCYFLDYGCYDWAIIALTQAINLDPDNVLAYDCRGRAHGYKGEYDAALADFKMTDGYHFCATTVFSTMSFSLTTYRA